jgi:hypothetical protein
MNEGIQIGALILVAVALIALAMWIVRRVHGTPEQRERKRRLMVNTTGRLGDAEITEVAENTLFYSYLARGVQYATSQDVTALRDRLPENIERLIGPAALKYTVNNPANSILVCEEWNGCRRTSGTPSASPPASASPLLDADAVRHQPKDTALT